MATAGAHFWSTTAASNSNADSSVNWAEGQAPSSVNDSARAVMASFAKWRKDNDGTGTTGGSSTAYTYTSNQGFPSLSAMDGATLRLKFNAANGATPTLNVDGLGAKTIAIIGSTSIATAFLISGGVYDLVYINADSAWVVINSSYQFFQAGTVLAFGQSAAPGGWTKSTAQDNAAIRLVSGTGGGTAGTADFTTAFAARSLTQANLPSGVTLTGSGTQALTATAGSSSANAVAGSASTANIQTGNIGTTPHYPPNTFAEVVISSVNFANCSVSLGGSGTALDFAVKYRDFIVCTKA